MKNVAQDKIEAFFTESGKDLYTIVSFDFDDNDVVQSGNVIQYEMTITVSEKLKAQSVEDMLYVAGYQNELGIASYSTMEESDKAALAKDAFGLDQDAALTNNQQDVVDAFINLMDATMEMFDEYVGETSDFTYRVKVSVPADALGSISSENITLTGIDEFDNDVNIEEYELRSYDEIYNDGAEDARVAV